MRLESLELGPACRVGGSTFTIGSQEAYTEDIHAGELVLERKRPRFWLEPHGPMSHGNTTQMSF